VRKVNGEKEEPSLYKGPSFTVGAVLLDGRSERSGSAGKKRRVTKVSGENSRDCRRSLSFSGGSQIHGKRETEKEGKKKCIAGENSGIIPGKRSEWKDLAENRTGVYSARALICGNGSAKNLSVQLGGGGVGGGGGNGKEERHSRKILRCQVGKTKNLTKERKNQRFVLDLEKRKISQEIKTSL